MCCVNYVTSYVRYLSYVTSLHNWLHNLIILHNWLHNLHMSTQVRIKLKNTYVKKPLPAEILKEIKTATSAWS